uniref:Uncharacterized protein n=1 Tax=Panagrolaimus sp. ES5 TaxID=591445 RepID=A0AC34FX75_9BILA
MDTSNPPTTAAAPSSGNSRSQGDIDRLEATLRILNSSLQTGRSDSLADTLLTEHGTLRSDIDMADLTRASQTPYQAPVNEFANFKFPEHKIAVTYDTGEPKIKEEINFPPPDDRRIIIFDRTLSEEKKKEIEEVDDSVYETTLNDVKALHRSLMDQTKGQRAFVPKAFIDAKNHQRKLDAYKNTVIRFLLPNNKAIQVCFYSQEAVSSIHDFIESVFITKDIKYVLCFFLKEKLQRDNFKNLIDAGLAPKSNLILSIKENVQQVLDESQFRHGTLEEANTISAECSIHDFIESVFITKDIKYVLCFFLKEKLQRDNFKNLIDAGLAPKSNLILSIKENVQQVLDESQFRHGTLEEANKISAEWLSSNSRYEPYNPTVGPESQTSQNKRSSAAVDENQGPPPQRRNVEGLPKWLKRN